MVINVEIILWRYKHVHVYVMWAGPAVGWRGEESLCVHIRTSSKERAPPPPSPPPRIQIWPSTRGALGLWGRGVPLLHYTPGHLTPSLRHCRSPPLIVPI